MARTANEEADPVDIHLPGAEAIVQIPNALPNLADQAGVAKSRHAGFHAQFILVYSYSIKQATL